jgi:hypothetical protein
MDPHATPSTSTRIHLEQHSKRFAVAAKNPDCAKRMTVWCILAVMVVAVFALGGYALYVSPGQGPTIQHERRAPALSDR